MKHKIIADSCCDLTPQLKEKMNVTSVPLVLRLDAQDIFDDENLNLPEFMDQMKASEKVGSASPPPVLYQEAMEGAGNAYVITLSSQLSGSYSSAVMARSEFPPEQAENIHILDSKSASAAETLIAIKLHELLEHADNSKEFVLNSIKGFIDNMKTYFVLENYDNLLKNGRLHKLTGKVIQMLNIKLIMGADGAGSIALFAKVRGMKQMVQRMLGLIESSGKDTRGGNLVISHCNNQALADQLKDEIARRFHFEEIFVVPTGGLSSLYADDKGIILAF